MHVDLPDLLPYQPARQHLYTADELLTDDYDHRITLHAAASRAHPEEMSVGEALAQRLHDHAIDMALNATLRCHARVVAVMGGHAIERGTGPYRDAAVLGWRLARAGYYLATGGGPGAMEAANLGAWFASENPAALDAAVAALAQVPRYTDAGYVEAALAVRARVAEGTASLAIPTWFYGHEPTNVFATDIAKYFSNSLREDGLLAIATHGVVYTPGRAGTVQEVFMDAAQNHYGTFHYASPMVFLDSQYWTTELPAYDLLRTLATGRAYADMVAIFDDPHDVVDFLDAHPPVLVDKEGRRRPGEPSADDLRLP